MRSGSIKVAEFAELIQPLKRLVLRIALFRHEDRWTVGLIDAHVGPSHGLPKWRKYTYRNFIFLAARIAGSQLAGWVNTGQGELNGVPFVLPQMTNVNWKQETSQPSWGLVPIRRPFTEYSVYGLGSAATIQSLEVAGANGPYFRDWRLACLALLYDRWDSTQNISPPSDICTLRVESPGPWLENIHIGVATLQVTIGGTAGKGSRLQVVSPVGQLGNFVVTPRRRLFEVPAPLPPGITNVVLIRGDDVLDMRSVSMTPVGPQRAQDEGVTFDAPARTESLESLIAGGEGPTTEFKQDLPKDVRKIPSAVSAFANTSGGAIFIGVDNNGNVKGIQGDRVGQLADTIVNQLRQQVRPFPPVTTEVAIIGELRILVLWVEAGPNAPFGVGDEPVAYYVRRGSNNFHATPDEIRALVRTYIAPPISYGAFGRS